MRDKTFKIIAHEGAFCPFSDGRFFLFYGGISIGMGALSGVFAATGSSSFGPTLGLALACGALGLARVAEMKICRHIATQELNKRTLAGEKTLYLNLPAYLHLKKEKTNAR